MPPEDVPSPPAPCLSETERRAYFTDGYPVRDIRVTQSVSGR